MDISLYLVTDSSYHTEKTFFETLESACGAGVSMVQLREKDKGGRDYLALAEKVKKITDHYDIPLIIDDRIDVALAVEAAGVHVGSSDIPVRFARKLMGDGKIVGATAKTVEAAKLAVLDGADYLGVGAIFPTTTKVTTVLTKVSTLADICAAISVPIVAIGGLNSTNIDILKGVPVSGIAVVSAIMKAAQPDFAVKELLEKMKTLGLIN